MSGPPHELQVFAPGPLGRLHAEEARELEASGRARVTFCPTLEAARAALTRGGEVVIDGLALDELEKVEPLARAACDLSGRLHLAPRLHVDGALAHLLRAIRSGSLGRPLSLRARGAPTIEAPVDAESALEVVLAATSALGRARRVVALGTLDRAAQLLLDHGEGVLGALLLGGPTAGQRSPALEVYCAEGSGQILGDLLAPSGVEIWENAAGSWSATDRSALPRARGPLHRIVDRLEQGLGPEPGAAEAHHALEILLAARAAAHSGVGQGLTPPPAEVPPPRPGSGPGR